ncbi:MAG: cytochrome c [Chloroflexi bacterium]|nr:MAG: cytochrome c [Chloroflexota bacterium]
MQRIPLGRRIIITLLVLATPFVVGLLFTYEKIKIDFPSFMERQPSIKAQEPPRRLPPEGTIPFYGAVAVGDQVPVNPVPADPVSLQRGQVLFSLHCAQCHGDAGKGDGPITEFWGEETNRPADLTDVRFTTQPDGALYLTLTQGFGAMPALAENLTPRQRWDVINYVRTLQSGSAEQALGEGQ